MAKWKYKGIRPDLFFDEVIKVSGYRGRNPNSTKTNSPVSPISPSHQDEVRKSGPFTPEKKAEEEAKKEALLGILGDMAIMGASLATKNKKLGQAISRSYRSYKYYSNKYRAAKYAARYGSESTYRYPSPNRYSSGRPTYKRYDGYQVPPGQRRRRRY